MIALAVTLQWADAMTFAVVAAVGTSMDAELSPAVHSIGIGPTLLLKAVFMAALVATRNLHGHRVLVVWAAALGAFGFLTNAVYMLGGA